MKIVGRIALAVLAVIALAVPATASATTATKHHLSMYKVEVHVTLDESANGQYTVRCPNGDIAADGMWRIDHVDQFNPQTADPDELPWNVATGVSVLGSYPSASDSYTFRLRNNTSEQAQVKLWAVCLGAKTAPDTHQNALVTTPLTSKSYGPLPQSDFQTPAADQQCAPGSVFISPGYDITSGEAHNGASIPSNDLTGRTYGFYILANGTSIKTYGRCLQLTTGPANPGNHKHKIYANLKTAPVQEFNKGNGVWEHQIECGQDQKGLVGGWDVGDASMHWNSFSRWFLGMDPRVKTRAFKTYGDGGGAYYLVCVNDRTSRPLF
jgi:hypothetical protein